MTVRVTFLPGSRVYGKWGDLKAHLQRPTSASKADFPDGPQPSETAAH